MKQMEERHKTEPKIVSEHESKTVFGLDENWRPLHYIRNDFEEQGEVVCDRATGFMWQKSGSSDSITYQEAREYVKQLNREHLAGYHDWRLPTISELISLLEPEQQENGFYLSPMFNTPKKGTWYWIWSADRLLKKGALPAMWSVGFASGLVHWRNLNRKSYVRAVRF